MPGIVIEIIGDAKSYLTAAERTLGANTKLDASFKQVAVNSTLSADAQLKAAAKSSAALKANAVALQAGVSKLPLEQQAAGTVAADAAMAKYNRSIGIATKSTRDFSSSNKTAERDLSKTVRGALAGTGVVSSLGRSLAFASGGFLAVAGAATLITRSISEAETLAKAQESLAVAIKHTGGNLAVLEPQYTATAKAAAQLGISQADATTGLARATVLTGNAAAAQRAYQEALVISKATGKDFNSTLTATAKGQEGITTSLRRYGILVTKTESGTAQLAQVMKRFGGQAVANTTATDRFHAALANAEATIGTALLPAFTKLVNEFSAWITKLNESGKLQRDVASGMKLIHNAATPLVKTMGLLADTVGGLTSAWRGLQAEQKKSGLLPDLAAATTFGAKLLFEPGFGLSQLFGSGGSSTPAPAPLSFLPDALRGRRQATSGVPSFDAGVPRQHQFDVSFSLTSRELTAAAQAQLTRSTTDDVAAAKQVVARIKKLIDEGRLHGAALTQALGVEASALSTIWGAEDAAAQKRAAAAQAAKAKIQAQIQNSIDPLKLEVALSRAQALGQPILKTLRALRSAAYAALRSGKLSLDQQKQAWDQIASLNQQITDALKKAKDKTTSSAKAFKQASTNALTADLGLSDAQRKALRERLAQLGPGRTLPRDGVGAFGEIIGASGHPIHVHTSVNIDGKKVAENTTRHQQRRRRRNSSQRRGPNAGSTA